MVPQTRKMYTFRYLSPDVKVYLINKRIPGELKSLQRSHIYSEVYSDNRNAVLAYTIKDMCVMKAEDMKISNIYVAEINLLDLEGICNSLNMPLNVILKEYCDVDEKIEYKEIFFYDNKKYDDEYSHLFQKRRKMY